MQEGGHLAALPDAALRLMLARLFERKYNRQDLNATFYDQLGFDFTPIDLPTHWDRINDRPLGDRSDSLAALRSGMIPVRDHGRFYCDSITERIRPDIVATLEPIDAYQSRPWWPGTEKSHLAPAVPRGSTVGRSRSQDLQSRCRVSARRPGWRNSHSEIPRPSCLGAPPPTGSCPGNRQRHAGLSRPNCDGSASKAMIHSSAR